MEATFRGWLHRTGNAGFIKMVADVDEGRLVGATVVGPNAGEILGFLHLAVAKQTPLVELVDLIYPFPTMYGGIGEALGAYGRGVVTVRPGHGSDVRRSADLNLFAADYRSPVLTDSYRQTIRELSDRLVAAQRPIRVLSAINWDDDIKREFFADGFKEQPRVDRAYYERRALKLDPQATRDELVHIEAVITSKLGPTSSAGALMRFMAQQFSLTVDMIEARGTDRFCEMSRLLYGTPSDVFHAGGPTVADLALTMRQTLEANAMAIMNMPDDRNIPGTEAVGLLRAQLADSVGPNKIVVKVDDAIAADAAAGSDYIKMREDRFFSQRDIDLLEAHEGWVHVSTTMNGLAQPVCTFLGKAAPRTTVTQEGLAVLTEMLNLRSHPLRLAKLMRRIDAIAMATDGGSFLEVFNALRQEGLSDDDAWTATSRVFRGSVPDGPPFTKDLGYGKGLILTLLYVRLAIRFGKTDRIPLLFSGKVDLLDMAALHDLYEEGLVEPPEFVPPPFHDLPALATTLALGRFTSQLDIERLSHDFAHLF